MPTRRRTQGRCKQRFFYSLVAWLLVAADRLLDGQHFYEHVFEMNTPGAVLLYSPAVALIHAFDLTAQSAVVLWTSAVGGGAMWLARVHVRSILDGQPAWLADVIAAFWLAVWLVSAGYDFGQREHLLAVLLLPFVMLEVRIAVAAAPAPPGFALRVGTTAMASLTMMIKPQFVLVIALLLLVRLSHQRIVTAMRSPEPYVFLIAGFAYLATVWFGFPEWMEVARVAYYVYSAYENPVGSPRYLVCLAVSLVAALGLRWIGDRSVERIGVILLYLVLLGVGSYLVYLMQGKSWSYHLLPCRLAVLWSVPLILAAGVMEARVLLPRRPVLLAAAATSSAVAALILLGALILMSMNRPSQLSERRLFDSVPVHSTVYGFASDLSPIWPLIVTEGYRWGSRFPHLWTLAGILMQRELSLAGQSTLTPAQLDIMEKNLFDQVIEDFERYQPTAVIVDRSIHKQAITGDFDFIRYFEQDARFQAIWSGYEKDATPRWVNGRGPYDLYRRKTAAANLPSSR